MERPAHETLMSAVGRVHDPDQIPPRNLGFEIYRGGKRVVPDQSH